MLVLVSKIYFLRVHKIFTSGTETRNLSWTKHLSLHMGRIFFSPCSPSTKIQPQYSTCCHRLNSIDKPRKIHPFLPAQRSRASSYQFPQQIHLPQDTYPNKTSKVYVFLLRMGPRRFLSESRLGRKESIPDTAVTHDINSLRLVTRLARSPKTEYLNYAMVARGPGGFGNSVGKHRPRR